MPDSIRWVCLDVHAHESTAAVLGRDRGELSSTRVVDCVYELPRRTATRRLALCTKCAHITREMPLFGVRVAKRESHKLPANRHLP
jgi:hypothetical protein